MRTAATGSSEMLVNFYQITWHHIPEGNSSTTDMYLLNNEWKHSYSTMGPGYHSISTKL